MGLDFDWSIFPLKSQRGCVENDVGNLRVDMDGVPLEGNIVLSCVQQDRFGGMLCLISLHLKIVADEKW